MKMMSATCVLPARTAPLPDPAIALCADPAIGGCVPRPTSTASAAPSRLRATRRPEASGPRTRGPRRPGLQWKRGNVETGGFGDEVVHGEGELRVPAVG